MDGLPIPRGDAWRMADVRPDGLPVDAKHKSYCWNAEYNNGARVLQFGSYAFIAVSYRWTIPPANDKERMLAELWAGILDQDVTGIGRYSDFLALGGDSLAAIRLVAASRSKNLGFTTQDILRCPILKNLAELAIVGNTDEWAASVGAINGGWIDHLMYDFKGRLDLQQLEESCKGLVEAHSILRSVFELIDDRIHLATIDEMEAQSNRIYAIDRISPLESPILRFDLIKASPTRHRLIMRLSHAQYDGFCADTFGQHLRYLYLSQPIPRTLPFP
ncbi:hypothetical protein BDV41DRAFT_590831 [Aspergillus transmontanensis]|uniref:Carrier domain-containing protein n=1 Tax=Aspergillus transmontanensis TaxID=1034304 RepID=A0A5N6WB47_9EURO|nr:hypothetical protein BDV41DRAFT_590831 [Aspergillus transmontanensis]